MKSVYKYVAIALTLVSAVLAATACSTSSPSKEVEGKTYDYTVLPNEKDNFSSAKFRLWCPDGTTTYRGVLYLAPGYGGSSFPMMKEKKWQELAVETGFALLTSDIQSRTEAGNTIAYWQAELGSGQAMLDALSQLAKDAGHPEIEDAPLAMWGFSAGGQFNYHFACWKPERVITYIAIKGGYYLTEPSKETLKVPALWFTGENDLQRRIDAVNGLFLAHSQEEPLWCLADEPDSAHEIGDTDLLAIPWLREVIKQRLPEGVDASKEPISLRAVDPSLAWLGDRATGLIAPILSYKNERESASWLPRESFARKWKSFHRASN